MAIVIRADEKRSLTARGALKPEVADLVIRQPLGPLAMNNLYTFLWRQDLLWWRRRFPVQKIFHLRFESFLFPYLGACHSMCPISAIELDEAISLTGSFKCCKRLSAPDATSILDLDRLVPHHALLAPRLRQSRT